MINLNVYMKGKCMLENNKKVVFNYLNNTVCQNDNIIDNVSEDDYLKTIEFKTIKKLLYEENLEYITYHLRNLLKISKENNSNCFKKMD